MNNEELNNEELIKGFDEVKQNQIDAEECHQTRHELSEKNADNRDAVLNMKSCERDKNREVCWKRRFYVSWGIGLTCYAITFLYMTFTKTELIKSYDERTVELQEVILHEKRVKFALRKEVDSLNKTIYKGIVAYSDANKKTDALKAHVENYAKVTISSLSEKTDELREQAQAQTIVIKKLANQIASLEQARLIHSETCLEDEESFAEIINSLPAEQKASWEHEKKLHEEHKKEHATK